MEPFYNNTYNNTVDIYIFTKKGEMEYHSSIHDTSRKGIETQKQSLYLYSICDAKPISRNDVYSNDLYMYVLTEMDVL